MAVDLVAQAAVQDVLAKARSRDVCRHDTQALWYAVLLLTDLQIVLCQGGLQSFRDIRIVPAPAKSLVYLSGMPAAVRDSCPVE